MERMTVRLMAGLLVTTALASAALADFKADAVAEAKKIAEGQTLSGYIEVIGQNSGAEGETLQQVYAAFTEATGGAPAGDPTARRGEY